MTTPLHERDFYAWTEQQAELLRTGRLAEVDIPHLIEEIESMEASERRELIHRLAVLMAHLLKWHFQPSFRGRSWQPTLREQRRQLNRLLLDNPSLRARLTEFVDDAYIDATLLAAKESGLDELAFPTEPPYAPDDILSDGFFPQ